MKQDNGAGEDDGSLFADFFRQQDAAAAGRQTFESYDSALSRLSASVFRSRFYLNAAEREYVRTRGMEVIERHAREIIARRLAPATIPDDGKQTPMRHGTHPVFLAQHATACCCRGCLSKWHHIPRGRALTTAEQAFVVGLICEWIRRQAY